MGWLGSRQSFPSTDIDPSFSAQTRVPEILVGTFVPFGIGTAFVFARFYSRALILKSWGYDDSWIFVSWLFNVVLSVLAVILVQHGAGRHTVAMAATITPDSLRITILVGFLSRIFYICAIWTTKLAICAFYRRVFQDRRSKIYVWTMMGIVSAYSVPLILGAIFQCRPLEGSWSAVPAKCAANGPGVFATALLNIFSDVALLAFVIPKILKLQIATRQKISLLVIVSMSVFAVIAAIIRLIRVIKVTKSSDIAWDSYDLTIWTSVDVNTGLLCASAAAIKPLVRKISPSFLSTNSRSQSSGTFGSSKRSRGTYGSGTISSRKEHNIRSGAIELTSQTDLEDYSQGQKSTRKLWTERKRPSSSDDNSERGVLGLQATRGEFPIRKTVSITVAAENADELELGRGSHRKFEHV